MPVHGLLLHVLFVMLAGFCVTTPALAQRMVHSSDPEARSIIDEIERVLENNPPEPPLACDVNHREPRLNFAFRYYASYRASLAVRQFTEDRFTFHALLRITPVAEEGHYYFFQTFDVAAGKRPKNAFAEFSGGFFLGEGGYRVDWAIVDQTGRSCRGGWKIALKLKPAEREVADFMEPETVAPMVLEWAGTSDGPERPYKIAVVLHASPVSPRSIRMTNFDQSLLTTMLTSLLEDTPFRESTFYAVNLEKQEVIYQTATLDPDSFSELLKAISGLELGTIGVDEYFNPNGRLDVLAGIVNREIAGANPPDAIVFIGPNNRHMQKFPAELLEAVPGKKPQFFYLHLDYFSGRFPWSDTIERLTKGQGGKVFSIRDPKELIKALDKMEEMLGRRQAGGS